MREQLTGNTALHAAAAANRRSIARVLVKAGASTAALNTVQD